MPRTVPSQVVAYLVNRFQIPENVGPFPDLGAVAGFLELYDQLPAELIRLSADDFAELVSQIATVRFYTDLYRRNPNPDHLKLVGRALAKAWKPIGALKDEAPTISHDLSFISDRVLQEMIGVDIAAVSADLQSGEWKGATIISGSCCEALLLFALQMNETKSDGAVAAAVAAVSWPGSGPNPKDLTHRSWDLYSYTEIAHQLKLISYTTRNELVLARDYRNLIHPAKSVREKVRCDRGTAYVAAGALEHVLSDVREQCLIT
jgi:hypothetical protein